MPDLDQAIFEITVGGVDVTEGFNAILEDLDIHDNSGPDGTDVAHMTLADIGGRIVMPAIGESLTILLGWRSTGNIVQVFRGIVAEVLSRGSRHHARTLFISAYGFNTDGPAKTPLEFHKDDATLQEFMSDAAVKAGLTFAAEGKIGQIKRDYWAAATESFIHLGQRIAREVGAAFKISGTEAFMWPINTPLYGVGKDGDGSVTAKWGTGQGDGNLLDWDIAPVIARPRFKETRTRWYDHKEAKWKEQLTAVVTGSVGAGAGVSGGPGQSAPSAVHTHRTSRADQDEATDTAAADAASSRREAGSGWLTIKGEPAARSEGTCKASGIRPGVDGTYRIVGVAHHLSRHQGFVTRLELKQPEGGAGIDGRAVVPDTKAGEGFVDSVPPPLNPPT